MMPVEGIVVPMVTPLLEKNKLDFTGTEKLVSHLINGGVHGLFILGTTGEGPSLSHSLKLELIKHVCNLVDERIPVLVGVMDSSFQEAVHISVKSKEFGAQAVAVAPPFFFHINQNELYDYAYQLIQEISLPVYLYNNPGLTKVSFEIETVKKLLQNPKVVGIKDSSADMLYFQRLLKLTRPSDMPLLMGPEELLMEALLLGANGGVPGGGNVFPELFVRLYEYAKSADLERARNLQRKIIEINEMVYSGVGYGSSNVINGIKCCLKYRGICNDYMAKPLENADPEKSAKIKKFLKRFFTG